ncbi:AraC family transcriptional regulator [Streptomyces galbus]|uniref:AraC family transcriptional regulator n=1 Tax=Streptomyces galbus TaxID=33898 RepID=A0A4U5W6D9_STRGB|nr:AraC family transcriptional regulator [Streptomyces galbus]TKS97067.1 AraC family transcriptional regulator [Streptomyces galbus]GHD49912.1 AraC family transcriptional regulator [Streptomyces galbus]
MLERLNEAMEHIERHLGGDVDVSALARITLTSEYHFRRLFSSLAGMPLSEYVRRRRLTVAAADVLDGDGTLLEVALRHGYGSAEAFARAFRAVHGVGPGEARRTGAAVNSQPRLSFRLTVEGNSSMRYRIVTKEAFRVVGKKARVPLVYEGVNPHIAEFLRGIPPETTRRITGLSDQDPEGLVSATVRLSDDFEEGGALDHYHAVVTGAADVPADLDVLDCPAGTWAVFENTGPFPQALQQMWADVAAHWVPSNPYEYRPGPEILRTRPCRDDPARSDAQLWIPVTRTAPRPEVGPTWGRIDLRPDRPEVRST